MATILRSVPARDAYRQDVHTLRKTFTLAQLPSGVAQSVGTLPANAVVTGGGLQVNILFNSSGTDLVGVGYAVHAGGAAVAAAYGSAIDVAAVGHKPLDEIASVTNLSFNNEVPVTITYTQSIVDATTGSLDIVVQYSINR